MDLLSPKCFVQAKQNFYEKTEHQLINSEKTCEVQLLKLALLLVVNAKEQKLKSEHSCCRTNR